MRFAKVNWNLRRLSFIIYYRFSFLFPEPVLCKFVSVKCNMLFRFLSQKDCWVWVRRLDQPHTQGYYLDNGYSGCGCELFPLFFCSYVFLFPRKETDFLPYSFYVWRLHKNLYLGRVDCVIAKFYFNGKSRSDPSCWLNWSRRQVLGSFSSCDCLNE